MDNWYTRRFLKKVVIDLTRDVKCLPWCKMPAEHILTRQDTSLVIVRSIMATSIQIPYEWVKCFIYSSTLIPFKKLSLRRSSSDWFSGVTPMPRFHSRAISSPCRNPVSPKYASLLSSQNIELTRKVYAEQAQVEKSRDALIYNCAQRMWLIVVPVFILISVQVSTKIPLKTFL